MNVISRPSRSPAKYPSTLAAALLSVVLGACGGDTAELRTPDVSERFVAGTHALTFAGYTQSDGSVEAQATYAVDGVAVRALAIRPRSTVDASAELAFVEGLDPDLSRQAKRDLRDRALGDVVAGRADDTLVGLRLLESRVLFGPGSNVMSSGGDVPFDPSAFACVQAITYSGVASFECSAAAACIPADLASAGVLSPACGYAAFKCMGAISALGISPAVSDCLQWLGQSFGNFFCQALVGNHPECCSVCLGASSPGNAMACAQCMGWIYSPPDGGGSGAYPETHTPENQIAPSDPGFGTGWPSLIPTGTVTITQVCYTICDDCGNCTVICH